MKIGEYKFFLKNLMKKQRTMNPLRWGINSEANFKKKQEHCCKKGQIPVRIGMYRHSKLEKQIIPAQVRNMVKSTKIEKSRSPYSSLIV